MLKVGVTCAMLIKPYQRWTMIATALLLTVLCIGCLSQNDSLDESFLTIESPDLDNPVAITLADLKAMDADLVEDDYFSVNSYGTEEYFHFKGVWVWAVINQNIEILDSYSTAQFVAEDNYTVTFDLDEVKREDFIDQNNPDTEYKMIIAWEENHEPYDHSKGNPFRLVLGQREKGDTNKPFWVQQVAKIIIK